MIRSVEISNFQSHKYSLLEFSEGVNVIKGPSHCGKSSVIRALKWALQNRPLGESFRSHFSTKKEELGITVEFIDGSYIRRGKKDQDNFYLINITGEKETKLSALRGDLPEEVQSLSNTTEINLQGQHGGYFLLQDSAGEVGKKLNERVGLEIIDDSLRGINEIVNTANMEAKKCKEQKEKIGEQIEKLKYLNELEKEVQNLDIIVKEEKEKGKLIGVLRYDIQVGEQLRGEIKRHDKFLSAESFHCDLQNQFKLHEAQRVNCEKLGQWMNEAEKYKIQIEGDTEWLQCEKLFIPLSEHLTTLTVLSTRLSILQKLVSDSKREKQEVLDVEMTAREATERYNQMLSQFTICPLCGQRIKK